MPYIEHEKDGVRYLSLDGKIYGVKYNECFGKHGKPFCAFSVAYDYERDEFGDCKNKYFPCSCWGDWAELVNYLYQEQKLQIYVRGRIRINEYTNSNGELVQQEQLDVTWVQPRYEIPTAKPKKPKDEFSEFDI